MCLELKGDKVVYVHRRNDTNTIFYVGMGSEKRPKDVHGRSKYWQNVVNKVGYIIEVVARGMSKEVATALEVSLIAGLIMQNTKLVNLTSGGECCTHTNNSRAKLSEVAKKRMTPEARQKISEALKGFKHTKEAKEKIRQAGLGRYKGLNSPCGIPVNIYEYGTNKLLAENVSYTQWAKDNGHTRDKLGKTLYSDKTKPHHSHNNPHHTKGAYAVLVNPQINSNGA